MCKNLNKEYLLICRVEVGVCVCAGSGEDVFVLGKTGLGKDRALKIRGRGLDVEGAAWGVVKSHPFLSSTQYLYFCLLCSN